MSTYKVALVMIARNESARIVHSISVNMRDWEGMNVGCWFRSPWIARYISQGSALQLIWRL